MNFESLIKGYVKKEGETVRATLIDSSYKAMERMLKGSILVIPITGSVDAIVQMRAQELRSGEPNCSIRGRDLYGPIYFAKLAAGEFKSINMDVKKMKMLFPELVESDRS